MSSPRSDASAPVDELSAAQLLAGLRFLDALPADVAALVRDSFDATTYEFGDAVFEQGDDS